MRTWSRKRSKSQGRIRNRRKFFWETDWLRISGPNPETCQNNIYILEIFFPDTSYGHRRLLRRLRDTIYYLVWRFVCEIFDIYRYCSFLLHFSNQSLNSSLFQESANYFSCQIENQCKTNKWQKQKEMVTRKLKSSLKTRVSMSNFFFKLSNPDSLLFKSYSQ